MDIFNKEKIAMLELDVKNLTRNCETLRKVNAHLRDELKDHRERELLAHQITCKNLGRTWEGGTTAKVASTGNEELITRVIRWPY